MDFVKMHGLGNDFIVVEAASFEDASRLQAVSPAWCDRHFGIGADGVLVTGSDEPADIFMRVFNPDGSEAEMCGNGIRCIAVYACQRGQVGQDVFKVRTRAGVRSVEMVADEAVRVDMGLPVLERFAIPVQGEGSSLNIPVKAAGEWFEVNAVSMGNPHAVIFTEDCARVPLAKWGSSLETHPIFPAATNVEFVEVLSAAELVVRVWERGAGITLACGTGACAAVVAANLQGLTGREVQVHLPGGDLFIEWSQLDDHVYMTGPAREVFRGQIDLTNTPGQSKLTRV